MCVTSICNNGWTAIEDLSSFNPRCCQERCTSVADMICQLNSVKSGKLVLPATCTGGAYRLSMTSRRTWLFCILPFDRTITIALFLLVSVSCTKFKRLIKYKIGKDLYSLLNTNELSRLLKTTAKVIN